MVGDARRSRSRAARRRRRARACRARGPGPRATAATRGASGPRGARSRRSRRGRRRSSGAPRRSASATSEVFRSRSSTLVIAAQHHVPAAAGDARLHVADPLPARLVELLEHLADGHAHGAGQHERAREEAHVRRPRAEAAVGSLGARPAHHDEARRGVAGEHRRDGRPAAREQSLARGQPLLDERGVLGVVGHDEPAEVPVPPAERGDLATSRRAAGPPGWRASSTGSAPTSPRACGVPVARSSAATFGASPASMASRSTGAATPSSCTTSIPAGRGSPADGATDALARGPAGARAARRSETT